MNRSKTRLLSLILAVGLVLSSFSICANAEGEIVKSEEAESADLVADNSVAVSSTSYSAYLSGFENVNYATGAVEVEVGAVVSDTPVNIPVSVTEDAFYSLGFLYKATDEQNTSLEFGVTVDGEAPFDEAKKLNLSRIYTNAEGGNRVDGLGNEFTAKQVPYDGFYFAEVTDVTLWTNDPYYIHLTPGTHTITVIKSLGEFEIKSFTLGTKAEIGKYSAPDKSKLYKGKPIIIEGEDAQIKTSYWLGGKSDNSSDTVTPNSTTKSVVNYIGGGNWKTNGETLTWETPEVEAGYYSLAFMYRQSAILGAKVYRSLKIDGVSPFKEADAIGFSYSYKWEESVFSNKKGIPYMVYLSEGKHTLSLTVVPGEISEVRDLLKDSVAELSSLYIDITMITGETVDIYRDYDLFKQITDMKKRLASIHKKLSKASRTLQMITGERSGSYISIINNMDQVLELMFNNRYTAHRYKDTYYSRYTSLASVLYEMSEMPLDIDKIALTKRGESEPFETPNAFESLGFTLKKFLVSFTQDYNNISIAESGTDSVTIWVNWGRDQAQVLNSLIQTSFTPNHNIAVNIQLVNASVVQAILSGKGPDCLLQHSRSEPVNLAMRGVLYDMNKFDDVDEVLKNFGEDAALPYYYKGGLYGLPDTQSFYLMYYRKDIFSEMGLKVPETWADFEEVVRLLATNNLTAWMPNNTATSMAQANAGIGSINLFPTLLLQKGIELYTPDGRSTNLSSAEATLTFNEWTDFYTMLKMPRTLDFYNRFRTGSCPIGISTHTMYTTLKVAAPEIDGLWSVALVPGTVREDGTISHITSGGGTACSILKLTKNPQAAWEFLKWWTSTEAQLAFSNEIESILGPTGRVSLSNVEAFSSLDWDADMRDTIVTAMKQIEEVPEYPGSYYVSRSVYQSFWNVVENNRNPKQMLLKYSEEANEEIERKWLQYENR
ncbi:MAG: extracellular solute-binding protein [Clostridia bacterium]|nr:extracellular solute-binding protein [Clostridia bacterium]